MARLSHDTKDISAGDIDALPMPIDSFQSNSLLSIAGKEFASEYRTVYKAAKTAQEQSFNRHVENGKFPMLDVISKDPAGKDDQKKSGNDAMNGKNGKDGENGEIGKDGGQPDSRPVAPAGDQQSQKLLPETTLYDLFKGNNPEQYFSSAGEFEKLQGTQAYKTLQERHELEKRRIAFEAIESQLPLREKTAIKNLATALLSPHGLDKVITSLEKVVPSRLWTEDGKMLTGEEVVEKIKKINADIQSQSAILEFNHETAKTLLDRIAEPRVTEAKDHQLMQEIESRIKEGKVPTSISEVKDAQTGVVRYVVNDDDWRDASVAEKSQDPAELAKKVARELNFLKDVPGSGDSWQIARQFSDYDIDAPTNPKAMARVIGDDNRTTPIDRDLVGAGVQFRIEKENAQLLNEIAINQKNGKFPVSIELIDPSAQIPRYEVTSWRAALPEEMALPLSEIVKNCKLVDYGFGDRGKVSLGAHDGFDHMLLFRTLRQSDLLGENADGRGYAELLNKIGNPQNKNMFNRESELLATIGYEWRSFHEMHPDYEPTLRLDSIVEKMRATPTGEQTANQKATLEYLETLQQSDPEGRSAEAKMIRHIIESVGEELTESSRKYDRSWLINSQGTTTEKISIDNPEYVSLIVDVTRQFKTTASLNFVKNLNLLLESRLRLAADQHGEYNIKVEDLDKPAPTTANVPTEVRSWLQRHPASTTRRAAIRDWPDTSEPEHVKKTAIIEQSATDATPAREQSEIIEPGPRLAESGHLLATEDSAFTISNNGEAFAAGPKTFLDPDVAKQLAEKEPDPEKRRQLQEHEGRLRRNEPRYREAIEAEFRAKAPGIGGKWMSASIVATFLLGFIAHSSSPKTDKPSYRIPTVISQ